jgi:hypothetical protein
MMKKIYFILVTLLFISFGVQAQVFEDDFEAYTAGQKLAEQAGEPWTTWSNQPGSSEDPVVSDEQAYEGDNSVQVVNNNDCVLLLGDQTEGRYKLSFYIYIPAGKFGYYNILQDFAGTNSIWGTQVYFDTNGSGHIDAAGEGAGVFSYEYDTWFQVENYIDLDNDWAEIFIDGNYVVGWQWTLGTFGDPGPLQISAANFYGWNANGTATYFFDNMLYEEMPLGPAPENLTAEVNDLVVTLNWDPPAEGTPDSYYILRDNALVDIVSETTYDDTLELPGVYSYMVKAFYDANGLSAPAGPVDAEIAGGVDRDKVLLEIGTGTWCGFCPGAAMGADDMVEAGLDVAVIEYHNGDPFATPEGNIRLSYYSINSFPTSVFDGIDQFSGGSPNESIYEAYLTHYEPRIATRSVFSLDVNITPTANDREFNVHIAAEQLWDYTSQDIRMHVALTESDIPYNWQGMTELNFVCREMYPDASGDEVTLENMGDTQEFDYVVEIDDDYELENCEFVIFLQDNDTKEVLNASKRSYDDIVGIAETGESYFSMYPNPATEKVSIEAQSTIKHIRIYNISGQKVYERAMEQTSADISIDFLNPGMYLIRLDTEAGTLTKKLSVR